MRLEKHIQIINKKLSESLVPSALRWWAGLAIDRLIAECISGSEKSYKHWTEISKKGTSSLNTSQL